MNLHDFLNLSLVDLMTVRELDFSHSRFCRLDDANFLELCKKLSRCKDLQVLNFSFSDLSTLNLSKFKSLLLIATSYLKKLKEIRFPENVQLEQLDSLLRHQVEERIEGEYHWYYRDRFKKVKYEEFPIVMAMRRGSEALVKFCCKHGRYIDLVDEHGDTPLTSALKIPQIPLKFITMLVERGANVLHMNNDKESSLSLACHYSENKEIVAFLLEKGAGLSENLGDWRFPAPGEYRSPAKYSIFSSLKLELDFKTQEKAEIIYPSNGGWILQGSDLKTLSLTERMSLIYRFKPQAVAKSVYQSLSEILQPKYNRSSLERLAAVYYLVLDTLPALVLSKEDRENCENTDIRKGISIFQLLPTEIKLLMVSYMAGSKRDPSSEELVIANDEVTKPEARIAALRKELVGISSIKREENLPLVIAPALQFSVRTTSTVKKQIPVSNLHQKPWK